MEAFISSLAAMTTAVGGKLVLALIVYFVGSALIKKVVALLDKSRLMERTDSTLHTFMRSFMQIGLYALLIISIIGILGVPMASVITVLASAGVTVGLALQGALSNLAGGIMLMFFRPFKVGDYVSAAGTEGVVRELTLFYTVFTTLDNRRVTVPNGSLMNANVVNFSAEELRRVDLTFACAKSEKPSHIQNVMLGVMDAQPQVLAEPAPFARISGGTNEAMQFTVRAWCKNADYWDVYFDLTQKITEALAEQGVQAPAIRVCSETKA